MKKLFAFAGAMALAGASQAAVMTFQYTATISSVVEGGGFSSEPGTELPALIMPDGTIAMGETVTGTFSYDRSAVSDNTSSSETMTMGGYTQPIANAVLTARFGNGLTLTSTGNMYTWVRDAHDNPYSGDSFGMYSYEYGPAGASWQKAMSLQLGGMSNAVLNSSVLPGQEITGFDQNSFSLRYYWPANDDRLSVTVEGAISSITLISAVPEPSTYAMFAAGLALLAWRRKRA